MSITVQDLLELRSRTLDDYFDGRVTWEANRADLGAIAVELDGLLSPGSARRIVKFARPEAAVKACNGARPWVDLPSSADALRPIQRL